VSIRLLIADDDGTIRLLLRRLLENHVGWEVCGEAGTGREAVKRASQLSPDVVILDLAMPTMNGMQTAQEILRGSPDLPILLLSVQQVSPQLIEEARAVGFRGAVTKSRGREVVEAVEALLRRETFFALDQSVEA
jgi:DNA-binding NarL/FixJ family response regulator